MKEMLERLKVADPSLWEEINKSLRVDFHIKAHDGYIEPHRIGIAFDSQIGPDIIQGCIQRAIANQEGRGYEYERFYEIEMLDNAQFEARIYNRLGKISAAIADSPAAALLAAYLEAMKV
jgi:hypothetical protein